MLLKLWIVVELGLVTFGVLKLRQIVRRVRASREAFPLAFEAALREVLRSAWLARAGATEIALLYYGVTGWFRRPPRAGFGCARANHYPTVLALLVFLAGVETAALHLVLARASGTAAWIVTGLSLYGLLWLLGDFQALRHLPTQIDGEAVHLRVGLRWSATVPRASLRATLGSGEGALRLAALGGGNVVLEAAAPVEVRGLFGRRRTAARLALGLDDPAGFVAAASRDVPARRAAGAA